MAKQRDPVFHTPIDLPDELPTGAPIEPAETVPAKKPPAIATAAENATAVRGRQTVAPECPYHPGKMAIAYHTTNVLTYYKCPEKDCAFRVKLSRPVLRQPEPEEEDFSAR